MKVDVLAQASRYSSLLSPISSRRLSQPPGGDVIWRTSQVISVCHLQPAFSLYKLSFVNSKQARVARATQRPIQSRARGLASAGCYESSSHDSAGRQECGGAALSPSNELRRDAPRWPTAAPGGGGPSKRRRDGTSRHGGGTLRTCATRSRRGRVRPAGAAGK